MSALLFIILLILGVVVISSTRPEAHTMPHRSHDESFPHRTEEYTDYNYDREQRRNRGEDRYRNRREYRYRNRREDNYWYTREDQDRRLVATLIFIVVLVIVSAIGTHVA